MRMLCSRRLLQHWCLAVFLLCSPVPHYGRPIDAISNRMKRTVGDAQLMHDKGRTLQEHMRRLWLLGLLDGVHTAETRDVPLRGGVSGGGGGAMSVGVPMGVGISVSPGTAHPKPAGGSKNLPISFSLDDEEGTNLPQETNKSQPYKDSAMKVGGKKKKKGRTGKRREGEKRKRRARSLNWALVDELGSGLHLEWRSLASQRGELH